MIKLPECEASTDGGSYKRCGLRAKSELLQPVLLLYPAEERTYLCITYPAVRKRVSVILTRPIYHQQLTGNGWLCSMCVAKTFLQGASTGIVVGLSELTKHRFWDVQSRERCFGSQSKRRVQG